MFISFPHFVYCSRNWVYFPKLSCLIAAEGSTLNSKWATNIGCYAAHSWRHKLSHLWRYCCIVMSRGPWLLRRCFKRGFGDHRKQPIYKFNWTVIDFASGEVLNFGLKVRSSPTLHMGVWAYTGSKDCLNISLKAAINILFICLW